MNEERYNRHIILPGFGLEAQKKLDRSKVLVVGAGGLGVPVMTYLNAMGVGTLGMVDGDTVSLSNLHRQILYPEKDIGRSKVAVALEKLGEQNSETRLLAHETFLTKENALQLITKYDVVVDASDNFPTRYLVNDACTILNKPFVYGALHGFEGQVSVFNHEGGPTYRCLFPTMPGPDEVPDCNQNGVLGILPGIIGNLQALETVKVLTGVGEPLSGKLLLFDALTQNTQKIKFSLKPENLKIRELQSDYNFECESDSQTAGNESIKAGKGSVTSKAEFKSIDAETFLSRIRVGEFAKDDFQKKVSQANESQRISIHDSGNEVCRGNDIIQKYQLIDVRTPTEFARNHLPPAINIPLSDLDRRQNDINFDVPVYVVCQSGMRSKKAIRRLIIHRPEAELINLEGGMNQIRKHGVTA